MVRQCCPLFKHGECAAAVKLRLCRDGGGTCVTNLERCCSVLVVGETVVPEWTLCTLFEREFAKEERGGGARAKGAGGGV